MRNRSSRSIRNLAAVFFLSTTLFVTRGRAFEGTECGFIDATCEGSGAASCFVDCHNMAQSWCDAQCQALEPFEQVGCGSGWFWSGDWDWGPTYDCAEEDPGVYIGTVECDCWVID
jgi:hypothetical protein